MKNNKLKKLLILIIALIIGSLLWLFVNVWVDNYWLNLAVAIAFIIILLVIIIKSITDSKSE